MGKRSRLTVLAMVAVCACIVLDIPAPCQQKGDMADPPLGTELGLAQALRVSAAMQVFAARDPVSCAALRIAAVSHPDTAPLLAPDWDLTPDRPYALSEDQLEAIRDGTKIALPNKPVDKWTSDEKAFAELRFEALVKSDLAYRQVPELFENAAKEYDHVTYDHLFGSPKEYRGKVVPVIGRMIRLRQYDTSKEARDKGIDAVYEAWIVGQTPKRPPYWVMFTRLPEGLKPQETMDRAVRFYGYFIKRVSYQADKGVYKDTVLLIGPTVYLEPPPPVVERTPFSKDILIAVLAGLLAIGVTIAFMTLWFRRGDRKIHERLANLRNQPLNLGDEEPPAPQTKSEPEA